MEPVKLTVWKVMIERVTVVKFTVNYGGGKEAKWRPLIGIGRARCSRTAKTRQLKTARSHLMPPQQPLRTVPFLHGN